MKRVDHEVSFAMHRFRNIIWMCYSDATTLLVTTTVLFAIFLAKPDLNDIHE